MWKRDFNSGALVRVVTSEELKVQTLEKKVKELENEVEKLKNLLSKLCYNCSNFKFSMEAKKDAEV